MSLLAELSQHHPVSLAALNAEDPSHILFVCLQKVFFRC